tara:strand:- start:15407 stop:15736 length:330 start_codon:yes stop_codon:yes gene_type:complete
MSTGTVLLAVAIGALATIASRALPFVALSRHHDHPLLAWLGRYLPAAIMVILVVYSLADLRPLKLDDPKGAPLLLACALVVALHLWRRNVLISIVVGTGAYMAMVQYGT